MDDLGVWLQDTLAQTSGKSAPAKAIACAATRWTALTLYLNDGRIETDNNSTGRATRGIVQSRKNYLFADSNAGGECAAGIYSMIETAKLNAVNPQAYLTEVIRRIAHHPGNPSQ